MLHTPGYDGWTVSRYRQTSGRTPEGDPELILEDLDSDGIDVQVMYPNLSLFGLYSDDHELSMAHARVYNDYVIERFTPYFHRIVPAAPIPLTDVDDAVAEIERVAEAGFRGILLPATAPKPYHTADFDPVWAAAQAAGLKSLHPHRDRRREGRRRRGHDAEDRAGVVDEVNQPMTPKLGVAADDHPVHLRRVQPQQIIIDLIGGGVPERFPDLHFLLIEFNAMWLPSLVGAMDKAGPPASARTATGGSACGTTPAPPTSSRRWPSCSRSTRTGRTRCCRAST